MRNLHLLFKPKYVFPVIIFSCVQFVWLSLLMPTLVHAQSAPLVDIATVEVWHGGAAHNMHCIVESADVHQVTSHGNARLLWALPAGSKVNSGQKVAEQDSFYLELELEQLQLELASAIAQVEYTEKELARVKALNKNKLVSPSTLNDIERQAKQTSLTQQRLNKQIEEVQYRLEHLIHYATEPSQVLTRQAISGDSLIDGDNILQLLPASKNELMCELPLSKYRESEHLAKVVFTFIDGATELVLNRVSLALEEQSQTVQLYLKNVTDSPLLLGERVEVLARYHRSELTKVPYDAVVLTETTSYVWRLGADNKVEKVTVEVAKTQPNHFLINSYLQKGDLVVTMGKQGLIDQQLVTSVQRLNDNLVEGSE